MDFKAFSLAVSNRFDEMAQNNLFVVNSDNDIIWKTYLSSFPMGTDPLFRERTEHDCSCCRHFVRSIGTVVTIQNGAISTIWDLNGLPEPYQTVANTMAKYIRSLALSDIFLTPFSKHGQPNNKTFIGDAVFNFDHFYLTVPSKFVSIACDETRGNAKTTIAVLRRGLEELKPGCIVTVLDLIKDNLLYRGEEHLASVTQFLELQTKYLVLDQTNRDLFLWSNYTNPAARFRNTVIGTLVQDLSEDIDLEIAVRSFETKVAPQNYKRPTTLITKAMVDNATKTITELGLESALQRRHAKLSDISVNDVLFVDNSVKDIMKGGLRDLLMEEVKPVTLDLKRSEDISIESFIKDVLPKTTSLNLFVDNKHTGNFFNLTAPAQENTGTLLKWNNDFAWSYEGNVTDSIKARVKKAGGQVDDVAMRVSLSWFNADDLDLHITEPDGNRICFHNKCNKLDVDMNAFSIVIDPVENIRWVSKPRDGKYKVVVDNYNKRESINTGFEIEIEGYTYSDILQFKKAVTEQNSIHVCDIIVKNGSITSVELKADVLKGSSSKTYWALKTMNLVKVNSVTLSPNYWADNAVGNKHYFFFLDGCKNTIPTRGLYNEFLASPLQKHSKVFEVLGDKMKCPVNDEQMAGIGFSSTLRQEVTVIAVGPSFNKIYNIAF